MALINCPECQTEVSESAYKCPKCGFALKKLERKGFSKAVKWIFYAFNIYMVYVFVSALITVGKMSETYSEAEQTGHNIGVGIGMTMIMLIWGMGAIIIGAAVYFTRPKAD